MKILRINNKHKIEPEDYGYGCECSMCGTTFIFDSFEATIPRMINAKPEYCTIMCPNCRNIITLDKCVKFNTLDEKYDFLHQYDE